MIKIELTKGQTAVIDAEDWDKVKDYKWCAKKSDRTFYAKSNSKGRKTVKMHDLILPGAEMIDHLDNDGLNNRKSNLRDVTAQVNQMNRRKRTDNKSGFIGVSWCKQRCKFNARIMHVHIGAFNTAFEAALAYDRALTEWAGEHGRYNF